MTQAYRAARTFFQPAVFYLAVAIVAVIVASALLATGTLTLGGTPGSVQSHGEISPAVIDSGREWEKQRRQQSGETYQTFEEKMTEARGW